MINEISSIFFIRLIRKLGLLKLMNLSFRKNVNGKKFRIPVIGQRGIKNNFHGVEHFELTELWMIPLIEATYKLKNGSFIDVGANIGQTLLKFKSINTKSNYIAFEPSSVCIFYLQNLIDLNNFKNVTLIPAGISNRSEVQKLYFEYCTHTDSGASLLYSPNSLITKEVALFDYEGISKLFKGDIAIIKIDVEGHEKEVLSQLKMLFEEKRPIVIFEILKKATVEDYISLLKQLAESFQKSRFALYNINYEEKHCAKFELLELNFDELEHLVDDFIAIPVEINVELILEINKINK